MDENVQYTLKSITGVKLKKIAEPRLTSEYTKPEYKILSDEQLNQVRSVTCYTFVVH